MKTGTFFFGICVLLVVTCSPSIKSPKKEKGEFEKYQITVDGKARSYWVYYPQINEPAKPLPVVLMFHGSKSSGETFSKGTQFNEIAEAEKFIAIYPDALVGNWAEGCGCNNADRLKIKDLTFVEQMIKNLEADYTVDSNNIFAVGFSQGGLFVDRLACEMSNKLRGAIVVAANMSVPLSKTCAPQSVIPMTFVQGTNDPVLPYEGIENGPLSLLSAKETVRFWAGKNGISDQTTTNHQQVEILQYSKGRKDSTSVTLFSIRGYGHGWPINEFFNANERIAEFISRNRR